MTPVTMQAGIFQNVVDVVTSAHLFCALHFNVWTYCNLWCSAWQRILYIHLYSPNW